MTPEDEVAILETNIARGALAKQLRDNPLLKELLVQMKGDLFERFESTDEKDTKERDEIWRQMKTVRDFEHRIETIYSDGERSVGFLDKLIKRMKNVRQAKRI